MDILQLAKMFRACRNCWLATANMHAGCGMPLPFTRDLMVFAALAHRIGDLGAVRCLLYDHVRKMSSQIPSSTLQLTQHRDHAIRHQKYIDLQHLRP